LLKGSMRPDASRQQGASDMNAATIAQRESDIRNTTGPARSRDRRRHERIPGRGLASHIHTKDASVSGLAVENISMGGMFVRSSSSLEPGTPVMLQVVRPGLKRAIHMTGRVVSVVTPAEARERKVVPGMGICLDCVDREAQARLRALVDDLAVFAASAPARINVVKPPPAVVVPAKPAANESEAASAIEGLRLDLAEAQDTIVRQHDKLAAQARRMDQLEAELKILKQELLRRNRTIGDLANRLAAYERV
jgi:uncharacterized coiled-coil protein SlyX